MSSGLNKLYGQGPKALYTLPIEVIDKAGIIKFVNLEGQRIKNEYGTDVTGPMADPDALPGQEHSFGSHIQRVYGIKKKTADGERSPHLSPNVVVADVNLRQSAREGTFQVKGWSAAGTKEYHPSVDQLVEVTFDAYQHAGNWLSLMSSHHFLAYYLPWKKNFSRVLKLGDQANFFFTSSLTGCTVEVYGHPLAPVVTHTNGGGLQDPQAAQEYMHGLLAEYRAGAGGWESITTNASELNANEYRKQEGGFLNRKVKDESIEIDAASVRPETRTIVVGFRDRASGWWSFYYQQWVKIAYTKMKQISAQRFESVKKKKITIKRVAQFWPSRRVLVDSWKEADFSD